MGTTVAQRCARAGAALRRCMAGAQMLAFLPAAALGAFWIGGEWMLVAVALGLPLMMALGGGLDAGSPAGLRTARPEADLVDIGRAEDLCGAALQDARVSCLATAILAIDVTSGGALPHRLDDRAVTELARACLLRLRARLRTGDRAVRIGDRRYLVILKPDLRLDSGSVLDLANRLQSALEEPLRTHDDALIAPQAAIGCCTGARLPSDRRGEGFLDAALSALSEAGRAGPSEIRAWCDSLDASRSLRRVLRTDVVAALSNQQIRPWFQPQICTSTGQISGVEALARWVHPERGIIPPGQFLEALQSGGHMARLTDTILSGALAALVRWDRDRLDIPCVSVNLSGDDLGDPSFAARLQWELDRHGLSGNRLAVEVLETVFTAAEGCPVTANVARLKTLGCRIDLDDFGTGNASIMALHNLPIDRVKIDRGFIAGIDRSEAQRRMVAGMLSLSEQLGIETLAEGVESAGEHALLAQLGCGHVQGYRIARPMPAERFTDWVQNHRATISAPTRSRRLP